MKRNDSGRYGAVAQTLHWTIAAIIFAMFGLGYYMEDLPEGAPKLELYRLHQSLGITILGLAAVRLLWRLSHPAPPPPPYMPDWERTAARLVHASLYVLILAQPVIGLLHSHAADLEVVVWGVVTLPAIVAPDEALGDRLAGLHAAVANLLAVLILVHIGGALRHHFLLKDDVLRRMLPGRSSAS